MTLFAAAPVLVFLSLHLLLPAAILVDKTPEGFLRRNAFRADSATVVVADVQTVHAACWALQRDDIEILGKGGELSVGLERDRARDPLGTSEEVESFLRRPDVDRVMLVVEERTYDRYRRVLPDPLVEMRSAGLVIAVVAAQG